MMQTTVTTISLMPGKACCASPEQTATVVVPTTANWEHVLIARDAHEAAGVLLRHGVVVVPLGSILGDDECAAVRSRLEAEIFGSVNATFRRLGIEDPGLDPNVAGQSSGALRKRWGKEAFTRAMYCMGDKDRKPDTRHPTLSNTTGLTAATSVFDLPTHVDLQRRVRDGLLLPLYRTTHAWMGPLAMGLPEHVTDERDVGAETHWERFGFKLPESHDMGTHVDMSLGIFEPVHDDGRPSDPDRLFPPPTRTDPQRYHRAGRIQCVVPVTAPSPRGGGTFSCVTGCHHLDVFQALRRLVRQHSTAAAIKSSRNRKTPTPVPPCVVTELERLFPDACHRVELAGIKPMHAVFWFCSIPHNNTAVPRGGKTRAVVYVNALPTALGRCTEQDVIRVLGNGPRPASPASTLCLSDTEDGPAGRKRARDDDDDGDNSNDAKQRRAL